MSFDGGEGIQRAYAAMQLGQLPDAGLYSAVIGDLIQRVTKLEQMVYGAGLAARTPPAASPSNPVTVKPMRNSDGSTVYRIKVDDMAYVVIKSRNMVVQSVDLDTGDGDLVPIPMSDWQNYVANLPIYVPAAPTGSDPDPNFDRRSMNGDEHE